MTELARAGLSNKSWERKRLGDGNGATVTILPASDGYAAISPREEKQWTSWLKAMGSPAWGTDPRFVSKANRVKNWDALHALMSQWSRQHDKQWIAEHGAARARPELPIARRLGAPGHAADAASPLLQAEQSRRKDNPSTGHAVRTEYYRGGPQTARAARSNAVVRHTRARFQLGDRRSDDDALPCRDGCGGHQGRSARQRRPGRESELHTVLGQAKKSIVLDLKKPQAVEIARALAAKSDILIENYATGVMDRLGLGAEALKTVNPDLIYISASGMGRTGPESQAVAYGTLLQCYAGFAGLNRHPDIAPRIGLAWLDPMCGLMLAFVAAAALWHRQHKGGVARIDFSMIEAMLWTMAEPLLATQLGTPAKPMGNASTHHAPHGVWRCAGDDDWISIVARTDAEWRALCTLVPGLLGMAALDLGQRIDAQRAIDAALTAWAASRSAATAAELLLTAGIPAAALARYGDLVKSPHLAAREFWDRHGAGVLPGLPWRASFGRTTGPAPDIGRGFRPSARNVLGLSQDRIADLRTSGALG